RSTPAAGAGTSILTFSVSSSTRRSPSATVSPSRFIQRPTVASTIDSPSVGTRTSIDSADIGCSSRFDARLALLGERGFEQSRLFGGMHLGIPFGGGRALGPPRVAQRDARRQERLQAQRHVVPRAHVARLLLYPDDLAQLRVAPDEAAQLIL